jgi:hypothetical protein
MFDTIHLWLPNSAVGNTKLLVYVPQFILCPTRSYKEDGRAYVTGRVGGNYRANVNDSGLSLHGSLPKYFLKDNFHTLTRSESQRAIQMMSDELHLPIERATVSRIDFAQNILMDYKPEIYYPYFGESQFYKRFAQPNSVYWSKANRVKLFYNKVAACKPKKSIPDKWQGMNVLRYELRFTRGLPKQFNLPEITAGSLSEEKFYTDLFDCWKSEYEAINKLHSINLNLSKMNSPKDFWKQMNLLTINNLGQDKIMQYVEDLRAKKVFDKPEYYSRLKKEIRELCKAPSFTTHSELVAELDRKIKLQEII